MFQIEKFSARLRELRTEKGESQQTVANLLGVGPTQVSDMERGRSATTCERLVMLCEHYKVSSDYLLGLKDER